jgi:hypothetical protein
MKKNTKRVRLQSIDATELAQVTGGASASPALLNACIDLLGAMGSPGTVTNVVLGTAITTALTT